MGSQTLQIPRNVGNLNSSKFENNLRSKSNSNISKKNYVSKTFEKSSNKYLVRVQTVSAKNSRVRENKSFYIYTFFNIELYLI